jgi:hypothetical protein
MALLKTRSTPPGGWTYLQVETQAKITAENEDALIDQVIAHRQYKGLPTSGRAETKNEIERQICVRLGHHECAPEGDGDKWVPQDGTKPIIGMMQMIAFSKAALAFVASGGELASAEEARRRSVGCLACPMNQPVTGCSCGIFYRAIEAAVPSSRRIEGLNVCMACSCSLQAKINLTEEQIVISNEGRKIDWPATQDCFQKTIMDKVPVSP